MTIGIDRWPRMQLPVNLIFSSTRHAPQCVRNHCEIGQSQRLDLKDDSGVLAALRVTAGTSATISGQMLPPLAIESKASFDSVQTVGRSSDASFSARRNSLPCDCAARRRSHDLGLDRSSFGIRRVASPAALIVESSNKSACIGVIRG